MAPGFSDSFQTLNLLAPGALYSPLSSKFLDHKARALQLGSSCALVVCQHCKRKSSNSGEANEANVSQQVGLC